MTVITPFSIINGILGLAAVNEKRWGSHLDLRIEEIPFPLPVPILPQLAL
jgi:hypothetical protein